MPRAQNEILKEIEETSLTLSSLRISGEPEDSLQFYEGWLQALAWVLTNNNIDEEGES